MITALSDNCIVCHGFASPETIKKNMEENRGLWDMFLQIHGDGFKKWTPGEKFLRFVIKHMLEDYDQSKFLEKFIKVLVDHIETQLTVGGLMSEA